jgi:hypothetical protein
MPLRVSGALLLAALAYGQQVAVEFDKAATKIDWILAGNVYTVHGTFQLKNGAVNFDPANGSILGELVIETDSGDSGNPALSLLKTGDRVNSRSSCHGVGWSVANA